MALTFVKRSSVPVATKGKVGTLSVMVGGNGSITFSTLVTKALGSVDKIAIAFDGDSRKLLIVPKGAKAVAKLPDGEFFDLRHMKKGGTSAVSGGGSFLKSAEVFGTALYDYAGSGNQSFDVKEEKEGISFVLPAGKLTKRPIVHRVKKAKVNGVVANPGSTTGTPVNAIPPVVEDELVLEPA